ncbi:MAG: ATP-grasp domain-containing protein [Gammaproteobacteria bacterium]|nr:ATP-grasp domain-containing protein [Gammaproteobacteria bacterium]
MGNVRRVLLIAPHLSYRIGAYLRAAANLDIEVVLASTAATGLVAGPSDGLHISLDDPVSAADTLVYAAQEMCVGAVVATDDATVELASVVAGRLGIHHNPPDAVRRTRRKDLAREVLREARVPVPDFVRIDLTREVTSQVSQELFPAVLKPLALSGSRGVMRVDDYEQLEESAVRLRAILMAESPAAVVERDQALLEAFIPGVEVALEGMLDDGRLRTIAIFDKPDPLDGPFFEETYYITPSRHDAALQRAMIACVQTICATYGLCQGPVHAELRIGADGVVWPLEVAARTIGGDCARLLSFGGEHGLEALVLAQAAGMRLPKMRNGAGGVLMIPTSRPGVLRRVEGVTAAESVALVDEVIISARTGQELTPLPEGASYLGFIFATGPDPAAVEAALRAAYGHLNIVTAPSWRIEMR